MVLLPIQVQVLLAWTATRDALDTIIRRGRDDRGELTAGVIFLVALAIAAVGIAALVVDRINSKAETIP